MRVAIHQPHRPTVHLYMHEMGHMELYPAEKELTKSWTNENKTGSGKIKLKRKGKRRKVK